MNGKAIVGAHQNFGLSVLVPVEGNGIALHLVRTEHIGTNVNPPEQRAVLLDDVYSGEVLLPDIPNACLVRDIDAPHDKFHFSIAVKVCHADVVGLILRCNVCSILSDDSRQSYFPVIVVPYANSLAVLALNASNHRANRICIVQGAALVAVV